MSYTNGQPAASTGDLVGVVRAHGVRLGGVVASADDVRHRVAGAGAEALGLEPLFVGGEPGRNTKPFRSVSSIN